MAVACGQGVQVMLCMTNKLLRNDLFLLLNKEHHGFEMKNEKPETDFKRRSFFLENTMIL